MTLHTPSQPSGVIPPSTSRGALAAVEAPHTHSRGNRPRGAVRARIEGLLDGTRSLREIAEAADCAESQVWISAKRMGRLDDIRRVKAKDGSRGITVVFPDDIRAWLRKETPEGATVADLIRAIVQDAYDDAQEGQG